MSNKNCELTVGSQIMPSDNRPSLSTDTPSLVRRRTKAEHIQNAFAIGNDYKNRNTQNNADEDEFVNFIGKLYCLSRPHIRPRKSPLRRL